MPAGAKLLASQAQRCDDKHRLAIAVLEPSRIATEAAASHGGETVIALDDGPSAPESGLVTRPDS
jgi:hypothetical protein